MELCTTIERITPVYCKDNYVEEFVTPHQLIAQICNSKVNRVIKYPKLQQQSMLNIIFIDLCIFCTCLNAKLGVLSM